MDIFKVLEVQYYLIARVKLIICPVDWFKFQIKK